MVFILFPFFGKRYTTYDDTIFTTNDLRPCIIPASVFRASSFSPSLAETSIMSMKGRITTSMAHRVIGGGMVSLARTRTEVGY